MSKLPARSDLPLPHWTFINGPAGSGKSTLATLITRADHRVWHESFAEPIREMIFAVFLPEYVPGSHSMDLRSQEIKSKFMLELAKINLRQVQGIDALPAHTLTVRETMIDFSERFMKPRFGADIFGRLAFRRCVEQELFYSHFVFDDTGFEDEAAYIVSKVGPENCLLVRLHREGCDFNNDSRGYIDLPSVQRITLHNSGTPDELLASLTAQLTL